MTNTELSVWNTAPTSAPAQRRDRYVPGSSAHPAKMLPALAAHAIAAYSKPGDLVLDPMCGIGTTLVEAVHLDRHALGIEYEPRWAHLAERNLRHAAHRGGTGTGAVYCGDARQATGHIPAVFDHTVDLVVTSPPYGASVHGQVRSTRESGERGVTKTDWHYSHDPDNLAHVGLDALLEAFTEILTQCRHLLRPGGHVVITTRPWRERGELIDLPSAALAAGEAAGLIPTERNIALLAGIRAGQLVARPSFFQMKNVGDARRQGIPQHLIAHEDVLVLRKPMPLSWSSGAPAITPQTPSGPTPRCRNPRKPATFRSRTCRTGSRHDGR
ncbi:TRM11 family SAM-dependent methyltransferase [Streptomyces sp. BH055]|uniref:TRM11 family SAM-dependent methyltransferase n=1 Tax=Streptomyces sp. BH055 TaxID=3401173 RepID=UPI003BB6CEB1